MILIKHAIAAITAGYCEVALITHGESGRSRIDQGFRGSGQSPGGQFEAPFGAAGPTTQFGIPVLRHFYQYRTTKRQLAHVAAATREWALLNPMAIMKDRGSITPDDVLNSRMVSYPFNLLDCCLVADGGGALVLTHADRARDFPRKPVYVLGAGESVAHQNIMQMKDFTHAETAYMAGQQAFTMAGLGPQDMQHVLFYDAFTFTPVMFIEELGFVKKGEGGPFFTETRTGPNGEVIYKTGPGGDFPMNTNGGGLSYCHTGMYGMSALLESVFQLRGEAGARQLPNVEVSIAPGPAGFFSAAGTAIMSNS